ncbi:MAG: UDP-3-O-acyl-N-acetylglucosamine deacetylase [candidate division NC10 bacterium]|nr:UDP-3-O-acyl-N-acetylglucosamine deacetylase [candidate division NC10 bacterium]MBI4840872.1 UDP-3-O-acyl-N-acetylglucosamine deacetylase [candidate division NC10 bacterium]
MSHQRTLERPVRCDGIGLHTGEKVTMTLYPAPANRGVVFRRTDLPSAPTIEARPEHVVDTQYATTIAKNGASVKTIEHLMSALAGMGVDNVQVDLTGPEVPILDGSAAPFVELLRQAGLRRQFAPKTFLKVRQPITVEVGTRMLRIVPSQRLKVIYTMCFDHPVLGEQTVAMEIGRDRYACEVAPSRTYGFVRDLDILSRLGLAKGGSLENAVVIGEDGVLNGPLRFPDELVRHKILDLLGDLYLLGKPLVGTIIAHGAGHQLHLQLVHRIQEHLGVEPEPFSLSAAAVEQWVSPLLPPSRPLKAAVV